MVRKIMQWVLITALLLTVTWRPSANYEILLHLLVCAGVILACFSIRHRIETHYGVDNRSAVGKQVLVRLQAWRS